MWVDKSTHRLVTKRGLRTVNTDGGGQKHILPRDKETKRGLRIKKTDEEQPKHPLSRDRETKGGLRTANTG